ncbi:hypothetical protein ACFSWE_08275 [Leucobacter albus]|uniref:Uncharacterized protein n=1 Tax=Leucobacter albus TaxID=272210 RepID=A0ABW3TPP2_9MICO
MNETTTQATEASPQPIELNTGAADATGATMADAGIAGAAAFAGAETAEILNLLGDSAAGGSCCGGSCCMPGDA